MSRRRHSVDQIIGKLRQADVELGQGKTVDSRQDNCRRYRYETDFNIRW